MKRHHPGWRHIGVWEGRLASARYTLPRLRLLFFADGRGALRYAHAVGMHLTSDQRHRGLARPTSQHRRADGI